MDWIYKKIFPNSYIINCNRDPMDICWSNYQQNYTSSNLAFAYNLKNLAEFYNLYSEYMNFWKKTLREKDLLNIKYENFTQNFEDDVKKLLNFCNLNWSTKCVEFYKNKILYQHLVWCKLDSQSTKHQLHRGKIIHLILKI